MRATIMHGAGDVRIEAVPDASIVAPTDAVIRILRACICGSDLWPYALMQADEGPKPMGHEAIGIVEEVGAEVRRIRKGDTVIMPFAYSDGQCDFCREGLHTACTHGGFFGSPDVGGAQAEALRVPQADGTLYPIPATTDDTLLASLLTLSDVMGTGHHAAVVSRVGPGRTAAVIGDGAVGLCGVIAARRLGAGRIILLGRHADRIALAKAFGATDIVRERGAEAEAHVRELTGGHGAHSVLECVGSEAAISTALGIARAGGAVGRVGVPHYEVIPGAQPMFFRNVIVGGGPAPVRAHLDELMPDVMEGRIQPGRVFDRVIGLDAVPEGYREMQGRSAIKVMVQP